MPVSRVARHPVLREFISRFEEKVASLDIAGKWDNVGLLLEPAQTPPATVEDFKVRVCIDLTPDVVSEGGERKII